MPALSFLIWCAVVWADVLELLLDGGHCLGLVADNVKALAQQPKVGRQPTNGPNALFSEEIDQGGKTLLWRQGCEGSADLLDLILGMAGGHLLGHLHRVKPDLLERRTDRISGRSPGFKSGDEVFDARRSLVLIDSR
jgi:hypothetical protein